VELWAKYFFSGTHGSNNESGEFENLCAKSMVCYGDIYDRPGSGIFLIASPYSGS